MPDPSLRNLLCSDWLPSDQYGDNDLQENQQRQLLQQVLPLPKVWASDSRASVHLNLASVDE